MRLKLYCDHQILITYIYSSYPRFVLFLQTKFTTGTGDKDHVGDDYFLTSGDKIRYFLEEDATDGHGNLTREKHKAVNKIGHGRYLVISCSFFRLCGSLSLLSVLCDFSSPA